MVEARCGWGVGEMRRLRDSRRAFYTSLASYCRGIVGDKGSVRNGPWAGKFVELDRHHRMIEESDHEFEITQNEHDRGVNV
jgi:hypothetical protein